jgi:putative ABC transport system substrate-binding protein
MLDRRRFLSVLGVALLGAPLAADAQQAGKVPRVGMVVPSPDPECKVTRITEAFLQGLRDRGWVPGQTIIVDRRCYATADQMRAILNDFVDRRMDVIMAGGSDRAEAAKSATKTIPIVMLHADPVGAGVVASLAHPGGNITGLATSPPEMAGKRLELLKQMRPRVSRVAVFFDSTIGPRFREEMETAARTLRLTLQPLEIRAPEDLASAFDSLAKKRPDAVVMAASSGVISISSNRRRIIDWANQNRLPTMLSVGFYVSEGALAGYGVDVLDAFRRLATYVDKVLKGAKPADLPVEQPTKFELVINLKTAKALGLTIPPSLLLQADQVIQ